MRNILLLLLFTTAFFSCNNDDDTPAVEQLPDATQEGRGIFGALINGEPFIETGTFFNTFYQNVNGEFFFNIQGDFDGSNPRGIALRTTNRTISEGETLQLTTNEDGNAWGEVVFRLAVNNTQSATTNLVDTGTVMITKLDFENNIVSGLFEMTVEDPFTGELVQITEGRFDTLFTQ